jgi:Rrf2 family protein
MQFTKAEEYGLFGAIHLAKQPRGSIVSLAEISENQDIPDKFLAKIFQCLTRAGVVRSHRGVHGGFSLTRPPRRISVAEILSAIQENGDPVKCAINGRECPRKSNCAVRDLILEGRKHMFNYYKKRSLQELAENY